MDHTWKAWLKDTAIFDSIMYFRQRQELREWIKHGRLGLTPHLVKQQTVMEYAHRFGLKVLVETGTYLGFMVKATQHKFSKIYSIELDPALAERARRLFARQDHVQILQGDSAQLLPGILAQLSLPCLFWLDAHYSGDITAKGATETPIQQELDLILQHPTPGHVILIDDAREFVGARDYPTIERLKQIVGDQQPNALVEVQEDIIRVVGLGR